MLRRTVRFILAGILTFSHFSALSQAHAESTASNHDRRKASPRAVKLAYAGNPIPVNIHSLNRFFDRAIERKNLTLPAGPVRAKIKRGKRKHLRIQTLKKTRRSLVVPPPKATRAYRRTFRILQNNPEKTDRYDTLILNYARKYALDPRLLKAIIAAESEFNRLALSPAGAIGLMQLMPRTAEEMGISRHSLEDPESNIRAGAKYIAHLFKQAWKKFKLKGVHYIDAPIWVVQRVIAAYNAGPRFLYRTRWYRQTRHYVRKVMLFYQSRVTDIRRLPTQDYANVSIPAFRLLRSSSGFYN